MADSHLEEEGEKQLHKEIIFSLTDVVNKIVSLHECSNEDFLMFNAYLKDYSKVSEKISNNVKSIIKTYSGSQNRKTFDAIASHTSYILNEIKKLDSSVDFNIEILKKILTNIELLIVPLKNFNLNLLTLKFLNSNLIFNVSKDSTFNNDNPEFISAINEFKSFVDTIKIIYPDLDIQVFQLRQQIKSTLAQLIDLKEYSQSIATPENEEINKTIKYLQSKSEIITSQFPNLDGITKNRFDGISNIITNLQYHDIIRQKMNHIQESHLQIIKDLEDVDITNKEGNHTNNVKAFLPKVRDIIGLQVAQLIHTNKQYQTAIEVITRKFLEIASEFASLSALSKQFSLNLSQDTLVSFIDLDEMLHKKIRTKIEFEKNMLEVDSACEQIGEKINSLNQTITKINNFDSKIEELLTEKIFKSAGNYNNSNNFPNSIKKIRTITDDIHFGIVNVHNHFKEIIQSSEQLSLKRSQMLLNKDYEKSMSLEEISQQLNKLKENEKGVRAYFQENNKVCNEFSIKLNATIEHVRYYDLFENISELILANLSSVYKKLETEVNKSGELQNENYDKIANNYTMKSQHDIHNKYIKGEDINDDDDLDEDETGELELF